MRRSHSHSGRFLLVLLATLVVAGGVATEAVLQREASRARGALRGAVARLDAPAEAEEAARLIETKRRAAEGDVVGTLTALDAYAAEQPSVESHTAVATAARAAGRFETAGRHEVFAARLSPRDDEARLRGERALDLAMLGRVRPGLRTAALASSLLLLGLGLAARARGQRRRRRNDWVRDVDARIAVRVDGQRSSPGDPAALSRAADAVVVDVFLQPQTPGRRPPAPGPTLSLVLSHAGSSTSLRLTPHHDVRGDAVRIRLKDATLARLLARPGPWRLQARLDDRVLGETRLLAAPAV